MAGDTLYSARWPLPDVAREPGGGHSAGRLLRGWRKRALMTQEQLAEQAGLNVRTVRRLENGELWQPRSRSVLLLAQALELDGAERALLSAVTRGSPDAERDEPAGNGPPAAAAIVPRQLPADIAALIGRERELATLTGSGPELAALEGWGREAAAFEGRRRELTALESRGREAAALESRGRKAGAFEGRGREAVALESRGRELALLEGGRRAGTVPVVSLDGMAGTGKTALAVHAAHRLASGFPDGQLFVDLHGHARDAAPVEPGEALARMLRALGVPGEDIPEHLDDRAALYRSVLADRRVLVVLDDAADEHQIYPLLPAGAGCRVIVTGRRRLSGLGDALSLDVLSPAEAVALFVAVAGPARVAGVPRDDLHVVVARCGLLPLAVRIAADRLRAHPTWSVRHLLDRLAGDRLTELRAGRHDVAAALDVSYDRLPPDQRRAYRLLGSHAGTDPRNGTDAISGTDAGSDTNPGTGTNAISGTDAGNGTDAGAGTDAGKGAGFGAGTAAALLETTAAEAERLLERLLDVHLLREASPGRYQLNDLVRDHAARTRPCSGD
ncbi:NB-ARC domain-containing protein [Nonomuraea sp. NPDC050202]|uniref:NB-ARC domain-containing protein n=1 Tax=Nonomuraea sp. NPDC050202 TaxID=3155035 RepID=UPI0033F5B667